jgi:DNA polymerase-3 subunit epsilon
MNSFVAFDFETANYNRHSICAAGFVFVEQGKIVDQIYSLINPEEYFNSMNISVHGIKPEDVQNAPTFPEFYGSIKEQLSGKTMVAHNLPFDGYALRDNLAKYNVQAVEKYLLCSLQLAKRVLPKQSRYTLDHLSNQFGITLEHHHHALADAEACAKLFLHLTEVYQIRSFDDLYDRTSVHYGYMDEVSYRSSLVNKKLKMEKSK